MRNSGNLQQQPLMAKIRSTVRQLLVCLLAGSVFTIAACTRMPVQNNDAKPESVSTGKIQLVARTPVGATTRYIDPASGAAVEISVLSEYFSAGGRKCRRFSQGSGASLLASDLSTGANSEVSNGGVLVNTSGSEATTSGLACEDRNSGWIEIPLHSIAG